MVEDVSKVKKGEKGERESFKAELLQKSVIGEISCRLNEVIKGSMG